MSQILLSSYPSNFPNSFSLSYDAGSSEYVSYAVPIVDPNTACTIEMWVKLDSTASHQAILSADTDADEYWILIHRSDTGLNIQYQVGISTPSAVYIPAQFPSNYMLTANVWTHIAVRRGSPGADDWTFFINGSPLNNDDWGDSVTTLSMANTRLAMYSSLFFDGFIDELRVWNVARSNAEILANYTKNLVPADEPDLTGYWRFEEGSGSTAQDETTNNNDGTLVNTPTYSSDTPY